MSENQKEEMKKPDEEKTKEELIEEVKKLRSEIDKLKEEIEMVQADNQMKDMRISFFEQTAKLENNRIQEYRKQMAQLRQEIEDLKKMKAEEYFANKENEVKEEEYSSKRSKLFRSISNVCCL